MSLLTAKVIREPVGVNMHWHKFAFSAATQEAKYDVAQKPNLPFQIKASAVIASLGPVPQIISF